MQPKFRRPVVATAALLWLVTLSPQVRAAQFTFPGQTLTVPDGFEVELAAGPPLVERPVSVDFDDTGALYVTDVSGSNEKPDKQLETKPHRIVRLAPANAQGKFTGATVFADHLMFPEGCLWADGSVYVSAPPSIWKLTDTNSDGIADSRSEWHEGKTLTGCANDLHGPYLGPDGWIYWCKGAFAEQSYELPGQKPFKSRAAHIFRARPDHSGLEPVLTGGMDNPVGLAFSETGERIMCGTFFAPGEPGHRDGLIHAIYGGVYGKVNEVTDPFPKTGPLMPVMTHMGPAAPCSVIRYQGAGFGAEYDNNLLVCSFNLRNVSRHILLPEGASFKTTDSVFLTSDSPDFHPTCVVEDADGSLLVVDTGGWYKICCPTSQLSKPDVTGAIYRIRRKGAIEHPDPRGFKIAWKTLDPSGLASLLGDDRPEVARHARRELVKRGEASVPALTKKIKGGEKPGKLDAVWACAAINSETARESIRLALKDSESVVRCVALQAASLLKDPLAVPGYNPQGALETRLYFELLGRTGKCAGNLETVLSHLPDPSVLRPSHDRALQHSLSYALIESNDAATARAVAEKNSDARPAVLIACDQMVQGGSQAIDILGALKSGDAELKTTALWVAGHHPEWGSKLAEYFESQLKAQPSPGLELAEQLGRFAQGEEIQKLISETASDAKADGGSRQVALQAMSKTSLQAVPSTWAAAVRQCLSDTNNALVQNAISAARALAHFKTKPPLFGPVFNEIGHDKSRPEALRLQALAASPGSLPALDDEIFKFLCYAAAPSKPVSDRSAAVTVLSAAKLSDSQLLQLAAALKSAGPLEMTRLVGAFEKSTNQEIGLKLMASLKEAKGLASLRPDLLKTVASKYPEPVQKQANELLKTLNVDAAAQATRLEELVKQTKAGDIRRGQAIFAGPKAACYTCHSIGYMGGHVGPDLTSIGTVRTERDLLESIIYPSASFVRSYEPFIVSTKSDESYSGLIKKDAPDEVLLVTGPNAEVRIARADIQDIRPGTTSLMPSGFDQQLTKQELADLVAFLKNTKWGP